MKNKNLEKLVKALRSGKYKQGKRRLNINNEYFCVLGVACEVAIENGAKGIYKKRDSYNTEEFSYNGRLWNADGKEILS